jgi:hypothetical protein
MCRSRLGRVFKLFRYPQLPLKRGGARVEKFPAHLSDRYQILRKKREAETLTEDEYNTLIQLSDRIEQIGAQRLESLASLAQLRQVSLLDIMEILGIGPMTYF